MSTAIRWVHAWRTETGSPPCQPGQIVVMDNLSAYKAAGVRTATQATGAQIENAFAKLKAILRKAAARAISKLWDVCRDVIPQLTPNEYATMFKATGYKPE